MAGNPGGKMLNIRSFKKASVHMNNGKVQLIPTQRVNEEKPMKTDPERQARLYLLCFQGCLQERRVAVLKEQKAQTLCTVKNCVMRC